MDSELVQKRLTEKHDAMDKKAQAFFNKNANHIDYLAARWSDESEYEDIAQYGENISTRLKEFGGKLVRMTKKPFGFIFSFDGYRYQVSALKTKIKMVGI